MSFTVQRLPALQDNYIWLLVTTRGEAAVVDPAEAAPVLQALEQQGLTLTAILNTHHHGDHVGGNRELLARFPTATVYASAEDRGRIPGQNVELVDGDRLRVGDREAEVLFVPGHTRGHIAYFFAAQGTAAPHLFCGDTLFAGGCGRLFEGTPAQMASSLDRFRQLPEETWVHCAHEYTLGNLRFAVTVDPTNVALNQRLEQVSALRQQDQPTVPSRLGEDGHLGPDPQLHPPEGPQGPLLTARWKPSAIAAEWKTGPVTRCDRHEQSLPAQPDPPH
jgi:hydroxyacylglutathione hydrolase